MHQELPLLPCLQERWCPGISAGAGAAEGHRRCQSWGRAVVRRRTQHNRGDTQQQGTVTQVLPAPGHKRRKPTNSAHFAFPQRLACHSNVVLTKFLFFLAHRAVEALTLDWGSSCWIFFA